jgi:type II secretion system protein G
MYQESTTAKKHKPSKGFTLIEMLIVVAILGLLASIITAPLMASRKRARDGKRIENFRVIRDALEMYHNDNGHYPPSPCGWNCNGYYYSCKTNTSASSHWSNFQAYLQPYLNEVPEDPINKPNIAPWHKTIEGLCYAYGNVSNPGVGPVPGGSTDHSYDLTTRLETPNHPENCGHKDYRFFFTDAHWCTAFGGSYPNEIYEGAPN